MGVVFSLKEDKNFTIPSATEKVIEENLRQSFREKSETERQNKINILFLFKSIDSRIY